MDGSFARAGLALGGVAALSVAPALVLWTWHSGFDPAAFAAEQDLVHREEGYAGSAGCKSCHPQQHASWERTFHRTMTQRVDPETVRGRFDGREVAYEGRSARVFREGERFLMEVPVQDGGRRVAEVALAVGSRRYQQYFERVERGDGFAFVRLPILWHIGSERWLHLNTVFLGPDDPRWDAHAATWNVNCIFCHNTGARPAQVDYVRGPSSAAPRFDSEVADHGIACESCHGPGAAHAAHHRDPVTRYRAHLSKVDDPYVTHPGKLDSERATGLCGQCHGQRLPEPLDRVSAWLTTGPTFRPGERLDDHVTPIRRDTGPQYGQDTDTFALRFWGDGTPRLTAYEYQGVVDSPCYQRGELSCNSCHTMHGGDPLGMVEPEMRANRACTQCHEEIGRDVKAHTRHEAEGSGSECLECHMPRMVYGILDIHRSHRIERPDAARDAASGRPNACTLCHLDKSPIWAAEASARWWGEHYVEPTTRLDRAPLDIPDAVASLLAGDAVQRAVYAKAAGRLDAPIEVADKGFLRVMLTMTLADAYPSVRWLAWHSLLALEQEYPVGMERSLESFDHVGPTAVRARKILSLARELSRRSERRLNPPPPGLMIDDDLAPDIAALREIRRLQSRRIISIGE